VLGVKDNQVITEGFEEGRNGPVVTGSSELPTELEKETEGGFDASGSREASGAIRRSRGCVGWRHMSSDVADSGVCVCEGRR
jgi:hypothetical protein